MRVGDWEGGSPLVSTVGQSCTLGCVALLHPPWTCPHITVILRRQKSVSHQAQGFGSFSQGGWSDEGTAQVSRSAPPPPRAMQASLLTDPTSRPLQASNPASLLPQPPPPPFPQGKARKETDGVLCCESISLLILTFVQLV